MKFLIIRNAYCNNCGEFYFTSDCYSCGNFNWKKKE